MNKKLSTLIIVCAILLTACGSSPSSPSVQPTATVAPQTATFTSTPEPTFTPTATPTPRLPVSLGTQMPAPGLAISADNIDQVVELARWGKGVITDAVYSPDGKAIAVATTLGVSIYQADTFEETLYFETNASVNSLAVSPDGEMIATGLKDNTLKLWKASDGTLLKNLDGHVDETAKKDAEKSEVTSVAFSPDGNQLAGGSTDGTVSIWQVSDGTIILTPKTKQGFGITSVFFSPDGQTIFSSSYDGTTYRRQVTDGELVHSFAGKRVIDAVLSPNGKILATYDRRYIDLEGSLIVWDVENGKKLLTIAGAEKWSSNDISSLAFSPDGQLLAAAWKDHTVKTWNVSSGVLQNAFEDLQPKDGSYYYNFFATGFSSDGRSLLLAGSDSMGVWDVKNGTLLQTAIVKSNANYKIAISPDGEVLAAVEGPNVHLWQINDGNLISLQDEIQSNGDVAFLPDGTTLIVSTFDSTAQLWPLSEQGIRKTFEMEKKEYIVSIAISPDGQTLSLGASYPAGKVELRQVSDGLLLKTIGLSAAPNFGETAFSSDGEFLVVSANAQIKLFRVSDGKLLQTFKGDSFAFSPDGTLLVGNYADKSLKVFTIPDGEEILTLKDRPNNVWNVTFSPDGKLFVVGYADGTIETYLAMDGTLLKSWSGHSRAVSDLLFTSDGKLLITSSYDGTIRMWGIKP